MAIQSYFSILEEVGTQYTADTLFDRQELFKPIKGFVITQPSNVFWLHTRITSPTAADVILSFQHLTYADLYLMPDTAGATFRHHMAGAFRPADQISPGDSRFAFQLKLAPGVSYQVLIRSQHTKQYQPVFDFVLNDRYRFMKDKQQQELMDFWLQGAELLLLLYVLITWSATRYRPYLWLALFIAGLTLYNLALDRYLIDWFFPNHPTFAWRLTIHFLHIALAGLYLLILEFWKLKEKNPQLYRFGKMMLKGILLLSVTSFLIHFFSTNFRVMSQVNGFFLVLQFGFLLSTLKLWKSFNRPERFLGYGVIVYLLVSLFATLALFIIGEDVFSLFTILSGGLLLIVSLLFLTGINAKLWQNERDKSLYLAELNRLQQQQNQLLEESVTERTRELNDRNEHIELLMNELNHRVKNNLQLLYSLNSLQLLNNKDTQAGSILKDNIARIKAMMLANDRLNPGNIPDSKTISPAAFIADITEHSKRMFAQSTPADIHLKIDNSLVLDATAGLCLGLIVTELITNSYKHAFFSQPHPKISIVIINAEHSWEMRYHDNGSGFSTSAGSSFGLTLIEDLTRQLKGHYNLSLQEGVSYIFKFPNLV